MHDNDNLNEHGRPKTVEGPLDEHGRPMVKVKAHWGNGIEFLVKSKDAIRPAHYKPGDPFEPRKVIKAWGMGFNLGSALKYLSRAGKKDPSKHIEDLEKAIQFIRFEIEDLKADLVLAEIE